MNNVIEIRNVTKYYGKHRGVEDVSFSVKEGEIFGFLGPNGAGKSTTIRSMLGFIGFERGEIRVLGMDIRKSREKILADVGYMPSEAMFYSHMRVKDVIRMAAEVRKKDCRTEAEKLCGRLQVDMNKKISDLSLGNRKKVSIVCAMQHRPKLFVFDEPTSGLDPLMQTEFFSLIQEYVREGATCMLSTHVLPEIRQYCSRVAIMKEGRLRCVDFVENLTGTNARKIWMIRDGKEENLLFRGNLNELLADLSQHDIADIRIEEPSIDETFMHFYQEQEEGR